LDVPAAVSVFVVTFVFWKTLERKSWAWGLLLGLLWGLALATKINAVFVPLTLGLWWLIFRREVRTFGRLIIMGLTAIPVFFAVWPWFYYNTLDRFTTYIEFVTTDHFKIGQYYFAKFYMPPPWHFGFVMLWAVLPLGLTVLYLIGIVRTGNGKRDGGLGWLLFLSALTPILAISSGKSMVYDNERLIMVSFPFLAGLAGGGFGWIVSGLGKLSERLSRPIVSRGGVVILILLAFVPQLVTMVRLYPHYLSYYGESVGGLAGATRLGLETTYWCETYSLALPIINEQAKPNERIWVDPWSHDVLIYYQTQGYLRKDLAILVPFDTPSVLGSDAPSPETLPMSLADWYVFQHRQTTLGQDGENSPILRLLSHKEVVYEYSFDGVPILTLYKNK
jgi:4-amino-4-deoxy-L-arabinose transferase-like glycosyltransferase